MIFPKNSHIFSALFVEQKYKSPFSRRFASVPNRVRLDLVSINKSPKMLVKSKVMGFLSILCLASISLSNNIQATPVYPRVYHSNLGTYY